MLGTADAYSGRLSPVADVARNAGLVAAHIDLVRRIARQVRRQLPAHIDVNDLVQSGVIGLLESMRRYHGDLGASFATYATYRIRGAMFDDMRQAERMPRSAPQLLRNIESTKTRIQCSTGGPTTAPCIAAALGISLAQYHRTIQYGYVSSYLSLDEITDCRQAGRAFPEPADNTSAPDELLEREELWRGVNAAIDALSKRDRLIMSLYYDEDLLLREIGARFALSESRISQILRRSLRRIRAIVHASRTPRPSVGWCDDHTMKTM